MTTRTSRTRNRAIAAAVVCAIAAAAVVVLAIVLSENVVYFRTVSEAAAERDGAGSDRFRMAGEVVPGTIVDDGRSVTFDLAEGGATVSVLHTGDPPDLFDDGAPVVVEGHWDREGGAFASDRILIKHDNEYTPPDAGEPGR